MVCIYAEIIRMIGSVKIKTANHLLFITKGIKMRKLKIFLLIALAITLFTACSSDSNQTSLDKCKTDDLPDGAYYLGEEVSSVYPYDNKIYTLSFGSGDSGYHDEVGYYDIQKVGYTKLYTSEDEGTASIYINENGIYYIKNYTIYLMDFSGKVKDTIEVEGLDAYEEYYNSIYADGNYIVLNNNYRDTEKKTYEYNIITVDLKTKETNIYPYTKYKDTDSIVNILPTENKNIFYILGNYQTYSFNAENGKMELMIDNAGGYDIDYNPADKRFYYSSGTATLYFGSYSQSGSDRQTTRTIGCDSMYVDMNKAITEAGAEIRDIFFLNTYYTGYDYIVWDRYNHTLCVAAPSVDTGKSITVVSRLQAPTSVMFGGNSENQDELYGHISTSRIDMEYEEEKKVVVKKIVYEYDKFAEKMRVKMLAGDTDYDVVLLEHAGDLFIPLFKYNLFLPLENYESIESGFDKYIDGVRDVMTYNGHIYGIPYYLESRAFYINDASVLDSLPVGYTLDDFLNLCSQSGSSRLVDSNNMTKYDIFKNVIKSIIEDGMEKGEISKDTIRDYVTQHKQYMDAGALNQTPPAVV